MGFGSVSVPVNSTGISHFLLSAQPPAESLSTSYMLALSREGRYSRLQGKATGPGDQQNL